MVNETTIRIRVLMMQKGLNGAKIARQIGVTRQAINGVINLRWKSVRIRKVIAEAIGVKVTDLWPEAKVK
jgi:lambda repressor-like predicted transcriptional regulator